MLAGRRRAGLWRMRPVSNGMGYDRGLPVDRVYIERFLEQHSADIHGTVLEVGGRDYTERYGGAAVSSSQVLHAQAGNPQATIVGDLATGAGIPHDLYDCMVLTDVLHTIFDLPAAMRTIHDALRPGGVALVTVPALQPVCHEDRDNWGDLWRFEAQGLVRLFETVFQTEEFEVRSHGNALVAAASIYGLAREDMRPSHFDQDDPERPVTLTVRAVRGTT